MCEAETCNKGANQLTTLFAFTNTLIPFILSNESKTYDTKLCFFRLEIVSKVEGVRANGLQRDYWRRGYKNNRQIMGLLLGNVWQGWRRDWGPEESQVSSGDS